MPTGSLARAAAPAASSTARVRRFFRLMSVPPGRGKVLHWFSGYQAASHREKWFILARETVIVVYEPEAGGPNHVSGVAVTVHGPGGGLRGAGAARQPARRSRRAARHRAGAAQPPAGPGGAPPRRAVPQAPRAPPRPAADRA